MKLYTAITLSLLALNGCASKPTVQRVGVGYNNAVANVTDQLALLNIVRAQNGYPLHFTTFSRLSSSATFKSTAGLNAQIKEAAPTDTNSTVTTSGPAGTTIAGTLSRAVVSGGNQYTPSIGGEVSETPSFDLSISDSKEFYQGITASIDPTILDNLIQQGYDQRSLLALTIWNINFKLKEETKGLEETQVGDSLLYLSNSEGDWAPTPIGRTTPDKDQFKTLFSCYRLQKVDQTPPPKVLAPLSRVAGSNPNATKRLTLNDLMLFDGTKLDIGQTDGKDGSINANPVGDKQLNVVRPATKKSVWKLVFDERELRGDCNLERGKELLPDGSTQFIYRPSSVPPDRVFVGNGRLFTAADKSPQGTATTLFAPVTIEMTFRSPRAVIEFLGKCLNASQNETLKTCKVGDVLLFELRQGKAKPTDLSVEFNGKTYFVATETEDGRASLQTLALIETLINLNRSSTDKPATIPVHVF